MKKLLKKLTLALSLILIIGVLAGCSNNKKSESTTASSSTSKTVKNKTLIVYFSLTGKTKKAAQYIQKQTGADIVELKAKKPYGDYESAVKRVKSEQKNNIKPEIANKITGFSEYGTILIGYPTINKRPPMIIYSLFNDYHFKDKNVIPFTVSGGDTIETSEQYIRRLAQDNGADFTNGIRYTGKNKKQVISWLKKSGLYCEKCHTENE